MTRGRLILIEGLDRVGKSTQAGVLAERLQPQAQLMRFPDRSTPVGEVLDRYLRDRDFALADQAAHLLFAANRWECAARIEAALAEGKHVILDRYVYSGAAYSAAKAVPRMDLEWCAAADRGLPKPDLTLFLTQHAAAAVQREGYGAERYEQLDFQERVRAQFERVLAAEDAAYRAGHVVVVDVAGKSVAAVAGEIWAAVQQQLARDAGALMYF
ncbi:AaceriAFR369Wp [[Ashbya] aceris (nom. inval.)]|nr:AaceriAFR369Wp [[Ashbya] aceris (nom. inval.)]